MKYHYSSDYFKNPPHPISVYLIGCGGTGSQVLSGLARINHAMQALGHAGLFVIAFDGDEVSETNIGRQLFSSSDIGFNKANVLISRINQFFGQGWDCVDSNFDKSQLFEQGGANIIISCTDSIKSRIEIAEAVNSYDNFHSGNENKMLYWMDFGNNQKTGQIILGSLTTISQPPTKLEVVSVLPTVFQQFPEMMNMKDEDTGPSCSIAQALGKQDLFINSTIANLGCALLWKLLAEDRIDYRGAFLNLETMNVNSIKI
jgi:PRTRC genetic system ThiF family protein